jgi:AcrR family transcriptional regulator
MNPDSVHEKPIRLRDRLRAETTEAILAAAEEVFAEQGLRGARMESIAARAGVAVGTVYNHFEDKDALLGALRDSRAAALLGRLDEAVDRGRRPFREELRRFLCALFSHWSEHRRFLALLLEAGHLGAPTRPGGVRDVAKELVSRAQKLVRRGVAEGALRPETPDLRAAALLGMARGVLVHELSARSGEPVEPQVDRLVELFLRGAGT